MWKITPRQASIGVPSEAAPPTTSDSGTSTTTSNVAVTSSATLTQPSPTVSMSGTGSTFTDSSSPSTSLVSNTFPGSTSVSSSVSQSRSTSSASGPTTTQSTSGTLSTQSESSSSSDSSITSTSTSSSSIISSSSITTSSSLPSTSAPSVTTSNTGTSILPMPSTSSESIQTTTSSSSRHLTTVTSSVVTTVNGQVTTIATVFPTTLNFPASTTTGSHTGVIAGATLAGSLLLLLLLTGIFLVHRKRVRRQADFSHRSVPAPRSGLLADDDAFDLAGGPSWQETHSIPPLMRIRGIETGSLFHEGVWPPPGERSRLEDPMLVGSHVDFTSIVNSVMGVDGDPHARWSSADSGGSDTPLLAHFGDRLAGNNEAHPKLKGRLASALSGPSETTPLNPSGHAHQTSLDSNGGLSTLEHVSPSPGAVAPVAPSRWRSARSTQTTGTLPPTEARLGLSGLGPLVVVNNTSDVEVQEPLVDLTPREGRPPSEIPPLYHMIRRDTDESWKTPLQPTIGQAPIAEENTSIPSGSQGSESGSRQNQRTT